MTKVQKTFHKQARCDEQDQADRYLSHYQSTPQPALGAVRDYGAGIFFKRFDYCEARSAECGGDAEKQAGQEAGDKTEHCDAPIGL